ncbi:50S ribosomal protein L35ae [Candidatus Woesearchaeota archaeon]|nr:50S ribosomal protein L35ae [Candidatus Woesearchaeota archaeon]
MKAIIASYVRGRHTQTDNKMILHPEGTKERKEALKLVGKKVEWTAPGKKKTTITGTITIPHGSKGYVRALFDRGMPGQSIATTAEIKE